LYTGSRPENATIPLFGYGLRGVNLYMQTVSGNAERSIST
jgi:hypothetical protein